MSEQWPHKLYEQLVETAVDVIAVLDVTNRISFVNSRLEDYPGLTVEAIVGRDFAEFIHPEDLLKCKEAIEKAWGGVPVTDLHFRLVLPDGSLLHILANGRMLEVGGQRFIMAICRDITATHASSEKVLARNKALSVLNRITTILASPVPLDQAMSTALDLILVALGLETGAIVMADPEGDLRVGACTDENFGQYLAKAASAGRLAVQDAMERDEVTFTRDTQAPHVPEHIRELTRAIGVKAGITVPLRCGKSLKAALQLGLPPPGDMSVDQVEFLNLVAGMLGPAIENANLNSNLADRVSRLAMLERLAKSINSGRDVHAVINACMHEIAELIAYDTGAVVMLDDAGEAQVFSFAKDGVPLKCEKIPLDSVHMAQVMSMEEPVVFQHPGPVAPMHERADTFHAESGSGAVAPLVCQGRMFGLLKMWCNEPGRFGTREIEILQSTAEHLSIAAHNAGLYEAERRKTLQVAALAKESQHRIRNNLQVVSGLLSMSLSNAESGSRAVERCLRQVQAIATVHELLSPEDMEARIELDECLRKIATNALNITGRGDCIELEVGGESCSVTADAATAVAVIVNELVSNAVEHGFKDRVSGRIEVKVRREDRYHCVEVIDDGVGLPADFDMPDVSGPSTGLGLMLSLAKYGLGGGLEMEGSEHGTCARIRLKGV